MDSGSAIAAGRFHHQWLPDRLSIEKSRFAPEIIKALEAKGHQIEETLWGNANIISVGKDNDLQGAADPRQDGMATGY